MLNIGGTRRYVSTLCLPLLLQLLSSTLTKGEGFCPTILDTTACTCLSYLDGAVIRCKGPDAPYEIEKLKTEQLVIRELAVEEADIIEIGPRAFRNLKIRNLIMDKNRIHAIHKDAFAGLEKTLVSLSIAHNKLTEIPTDALIGMESLLVLNLKCNNIGNIYTPALHNVSRLIELNLACNQICKISGSAFEPIKGTLQSLILDHNCLREVPAEALRNFKSLLALHLQHNNIETIEKLQLMNMVSLLMVRLSHNKIKSIDRYGFNNIPNMRYLFLDHNQLNVIEPNVLQQFQHLEIADLSYNNIAEITAGVFHGLDRLLQLNLEGNVIQDIAPNAFAQTPLLLLLLGQNCLTGISQSMFHGIPFLRQLSMANNNIKNIQPFAFTSLANLQLLDLSGNKLDSVFPATLAPNFGSTIILSENPLVCGPGGYHVVQGGKPVMLLNEQNLICNYQNRSRPDNCPNRKPVVHKSGCCGPDDEAGNADLHHIPSELIDKQTQLEFPDMLKLPSSKSPEATEKQYTTSTRMRATAVTPTDTTVTPFTTSAPMEPTTSKQTKSRTPNMQRFWRLTRPPIKEDQMLITTTLPEVKIQTLQVKAMTPEEQSKQRVLQASRGTLQAVQKNNQHEREAWSTNGFSRPPQPETVTSATILMFNKANATAYLGQRQPHTSKRIETQKNLSPPLHAGMQGRPTQIATRLIAPSLPRPNPNYISSTARQFQYHRVPTEMQIRGGIQSAERPTGLQNPIHQTNGPIHDNFGRPFDGRNVVAQHTGQNVMEFPAQISKLEIPVLRSQTQQDIPAAVHRHTGTAQLDPRLHHVTGNQLSPAVNSNAVRNITRLSHVQREFQPNHFRHFVPEDGFTANNRQEQGRESMEQLGHRRVDSAQSGNLDLVEKTVFMPQQHLQWQVPVSAPEIEVANEPQTFGPTEVQGIERIPFNSEPFVGLHYRPASEEPRENSGKLKAQQAHPIPFAQKMQ